MIKSKIFAVSLEKKYRFPEETTPIIKPEISAGVGLASSDFLPDKTRIILKPMIFAGTMLKNDHSLPEKAKPIIKTMASKGPLEKKHSLPEETTPIIKPEISEGDPDGIAAIQEKITPIIKLEIPDGYDQDKSDPLPEKTTPIIKPEIPDGYDQDKSDFLSDFLPDNTKFIIKPRISAGTRLESNYFLTETDERAVYTFLIQPGFRLGVEKPKLKVNLDYTAEIYFYQDMDDVEPDQRKVDDLNYVGHLANLQITYALTPRLMLNLNDAFYLSRYPAAYDRLSNSTDRRKYWINRLSPAVSYDFGNRFSARMMYRYEELNFIKTDIEDSTEHAISFNVFYNLTRTTTFDLDYQYWDRTYKAGDYSNYASHQAMAGYQNRYKYFSFDGRVGYQHRTLDDPGLKDENALVFKLSFGGETPPPPETRRQTGGITERAKNHIYLSAERNLNNVGDNYIADRFTLSAGHVFQRKISALLRGYYQISDYQTFEGITKDGNYVRRDDSSYDVFGRIGYLITKKMNVSISAGQARRDSNIRGFDYTNNYVYFRFDFNYDVGSRGGFGEEAVYY
ncbi:MAG: outer membrane beta-barrel protein [Desulfobacteraceae bacterium]|nr:outer membrane beta-barrel protein [Desulfobacteraceae bacterium]